MTSGPFTCRFHRQGRCKFGRNCRFLHTSPAHVGSADSDDSDDSQSDSMLNSRQTQRQRRAPLQPRPGTSSAQETSESANGHSSVNKKTRPGARAPQHLPSASGSSISPKATVLRKKPSSLNDASNDCTSLPRPPNEWVQAPEFVPNKSNDHTIPETKGHKSYAEVVNTSAGNNGEWTPPVKLNVLCPYSEAGECKLGDACTYLHGLLCELCGKACLHPFDKEQHKKHHSECVKQHEKDMELSFAVARSKDKMCGICFEVIMEKNHREQRFGILPNCNHCFCLSCIRTWRQAKQFENNITRACPECRVTSDFVCPSMYWVDTKEDKEKLITDYKGALSTKDCKYFKKGEGKCPFGNKCFYQHVLPDGSPVDVGPPSRQRRRNAERDVDMLQHIILWDFLEDREAQAHLLYLDSIDFDDSFFSDSDFTDSDIDFV